MPQPSNAQILDRLDEIFERPEFGSGDRPLNLLEMFLRWLQQTLSRLGDASPVVFWLVIGVCVLLLALLIIYVVWTLRQMAFISARAARAKEEQGARRRLSAACVEEANRLAAAGEFTEAIRFLFLSLVYRFDEEGRVNFQRAYTNREYLALFADRRPLYTDLKLFVDLLDDNWYGERPSTAQQYEQCRELHQALTE